MDLWILARFMMFDEVENSCKVLQMKHFTRLWYPDIPWFLHMIWEMGKVFQRAQIVYAVRSSLRNMWSKAVMWPKQLETFGISYFIDKILYLYLYLAVAINLLTACIIVCVFFICIYLYLSICSLHLCMSVNYVSVSVSHGIWYNKILT